MTAASPAAQASPRGKRADALRNERTLLAAAASVFVASGVDAPIREIATAAGVGIGTIYRHFPTRADLIVAVFRHQVEACAAGLAAVTRPSPHNFGTLIRFECNRSRSRRAVAVFLTCFGPPLLRHCVLF